MDDTLRCERGMARLLWRPAPRASESVQGSPEAATRRLGTRHAAAPGRPFRRCSWAMRERFRRGEDGSNIVEFVIILPLLLTLVFGLITAGIAFSNKLSTTNGAREAARYAATLPPPEDALGTWFEDVISTAENSSSGDLDTDRDDHLVCVARTADGSTWESARQQGGTLTMGADSCFTDTRDDARVQVRVQRPGEIDAIFYRFDVTLTGQAVARWEPAT